MGSSALSVPESGLKHTIGGAVGFVSGGICIRPTLIATSIALSRARGSVEVGAVVPQS